jgi:hypothetical protein
MQKFSVEPSWSGVLGVFGALCRPDYCALCSERATDGIEWRDREVRLCTVHWLISACGCGPYAVPLWHDVLPVESAVPPQPSLRAIPRGGEATISESLPTPPVARRVLSLPGGARRSVRQTADRATIAPP